MAIPLAFTLEKFPDHAAIIGDLVIGYGEIEFLMIALVAEALGSKAGRGDIGDATRIIYRLRGAESRLKVADAIIRPFMNKIRLGGQYGVWLGAMRRCRQIRNQYAHCHWREQAGRLHFMSLEDAADPEHGDLIYRPIDLSLLKEQQAFFDYAIKVLLFLYDESRFRRDRRRKHRRRLPKSRVLPNLHSPLD
jgi:hypothetical protein